jgi:16S rRNA (uracil1498-N3)-methyltransferase
VEKCVELGASRLVPVISSRSRVQGHEVGREKMARWARIAAEAQKQCGRTDPLDILQPVALMELLYGHEAIQGKSSLFLLDRDGEAPGAAGAPTDPVLLIGPEGGFSEEEKEAAFKAAFKPLSLGQLSLKTETAALAALAIMRLWPGGQA